jgi:PKHD-type hydroxylase
MFEELLNNVTVANQKAGEGFVFPSFTPHCVTPVTSGIRYSLVMWSYGPKFV